MICTAPSTPPPSPIIPTVLPDSFLDLNLQSFNRPPTLDGVPDEFHSDDVQAFLRLLRREPGKVDTYHRTRLFLVGSGGAGKTCLVRSLVEGIHINDDDLAMPMTDGLVVGDWTIPTDDLPDDNDVRTKADGQPLRIGTWDLGGKMKLFN